MQYIVAFLIGFIISLPLLPLLYFIIHHPIERIDIKIPILYGLFNIINIYLQHKYKKIQ